MNAFVMCGDIPVVEFNLTDYYCNILREDLLPIPLRFKLRVSCETSTMADHINNYNSLVRWLASRTLLLSRANAKWLYNLIGVDQIDSEVHRAKISLLCKAVSILDNYWVKSKSGPQVWADVNLRHNSLNDVVTQVALHGKSLTLQGSLTTPEYTTKGAYAKAWVRRDDGNLWLYKLGAKDATESRIEVMCSNLLDKMNVEHVHYEASEHSGKYVCACPAMTSDDLSIVSGSEFYSYCTIQGKDTDLELSKLDPDAINKMAIVDYLISNKDRHGENWGLYYDANTSEILRCHPLFDHNNAFDLKYMQEPDSTYLYNGKSLRQSALYAVKRVDFHFTKQITKDDFITTRQYDSFMKRAEELHIETVAEQDNWSRYVSKYGIQDEARELHRLSGVYHTKSIDIIKEKVAKDFL